tara:strand:- start:342 stop:494 length:153 start_codon:yes stop_codon:yes gene_type:complete
MKVEKITTSDIIYKGNKKTKISRNCTTNKLIIESEDIEFINMLKSKKGFK